MARQNLSVAATPLKDIGILTEGKLGILGGVFFAVYSLGRLINGRLGDKLSQRLMISVGLLLIAASNLGFSFFPDFSICALLWGFNAFGQSMLWGSLIAVVYRSFPKDRAVRTVSFLATSTAAGTVLGVAVSTGIISVTSPSAAFIFISLLALLSAVFAFFSTKNKQGETASEKAVPPPMKIKELLRDKTIISSQIPAFIHGTMKDNVNMWMCVYFLDRFGLDIDGSVLLVIFIPVIGFVGRLLYPSLLRLCGYSEKKVNVVAFFSIILSCAPLVLSLGSYVTAAFCLGVISAGISIINTSLLSVLPVKYAPSGASSTVSGIIDFTTYLGAGVSSLFYGFLLEFADYSYMYLSWAVLSLIAIAAAAIGITNTEK